MKTLAPFLPLLLSDFLLLSFASTHTNTSPLRSGRDRVANETSLIRDREKRISIGALEKLRERRKDRGCVRARRRGCLAARVPIETWHVAGLFRKSGGLLQQRGADVREQPVRGSIKRGYCLVEGVCGRKKLG